MTNEPDPQIGTEQSTVLETIQIRGDKTWFHPKADSPDWLSRIAEIMLSENLVVLCGLGTSLCLNQDGEPRIAPTMGDLWDKVAPLPGFDAIRTKVGYPNTESNIEDFMSRCQLYQALTPDPLVKDFVDKAEQTIQDACSFAKNGHTLPTHEAFLRKLGRRSSRQPRLRLFTTNYDLCFEVASSTAGFVVIDGFSHSSPQCFDGAYFSYDLVRRDYEGDGLTFIPNVFQLFKLHGSVDWDSDQASDGRVVRRPTQHPAMIYPRVGKFESSYQQPFFELMSRFQSALRQPNTGLIAIGYGFNDKHINEPILTALRSNVGLKCALVDPAIPDSTNHVLKAYTDLIDGGDVRLTAVAARFEHFVVHMPDLVALSEAELHQARTKKLFNL